MKQFDQSVNHFILFIFLLIVIDELHYFVLCGSILNSESNNEWHSKTLNSDSFHPVKQKRKKKERIIQLNIRVSPSDHPYHFRIVTLPLVFHTNTKFILSIINSQTQWNYPVSTYAIVNMIFLISRLEIKYLSYSYNDRQWVNQLS